MFITIQKNTKFMVLRPSQNQGLSAGTVLTKETNWNQTIEFSWELYRLVVLFLLFYVICASVPTEGTQKHMDWGIQVSIQVNNHQSSSVHNSPKHICSFSFLILLYLRYTVLLQKFSFTFSTVIYFILFIYTFAT